MDIPHVPPRPQTPNLCLSLQIKLKIDPQQYMVNTVFPLKILFDKLTT